MRRHRATLVTLLAFTGLATAYWVHRVHVERPSRMAYQNADLFGYFLPNAVFLHDRLQRGSVPLWNPYQFAGQPHLGFHIQGPLYPLNLLLMKWLRPVPALEVHAIAHLAIAGFFTWLLTARMGLGRPARAAASVGYMLSRPVLDGVYSPAYLATYAWLPAIVWSIHGLASEVRPRWAFALGICVALAFLGGYAQAFVYEVQFAGAYGLFAVAFLTPAAARGRAIGIAGAAGAIAVCLVAPQLVATLELMRDSVRDLGGVDLAQAAWGQWSVGTGPGSLLAHLLGTSGPSPYGARFLLLPVIGIPLIACGALARDQRSHWGCFGIAAIAIAAMLVGTASPAFGWYYALPLGNLFRLAPVRIEFLFWFAMALLTALGIHGLSAALGRYSDRKWLSTGVGLAVAGAIVWSFYARSGLAFAHPATRPPDPSATASLLGFLRERGSPERFFVENSLLQQLQDSSLPFKIGMMHRVFAVPDYEPNMPGRYARYFGMPDTPPWHGRISVTSSSSDASGLPRADLRQLDGMSVRYYITPIDSPERTVRDLEAIASGERRRFGGVLVFERDRALPRAYTIAREVRVVDDAAALEYVRSDAFAPRREVVVIGADAGAPEPGVARADSEFRPARIDRYADDAVVIAADCDVACLLVLTDLDYPGWRAWVDGTQRPVLRANGLYRAVRLEAGTHSVVYRYEPRLLYASLLLPVVAIAAWIAWSIRDRRSGRTIRSV